MSKFSSYHNYGIKSRLAPVGRNGFTIVELLIVVVVIAILAAITVVAYNGITRSAHESAVKSDLTTAAKKLQIAKVNDGTFPSEAPANTTATEFSYTPDGNSFCLSATSTAIPGLKFKITEGGAVEVGECEVVVNYVAAGSEHSCALAGGKAYCWGRNISGRLGDGTTVDKSTPTLVSQGAIPVGDTIQQVVVGGGYTCVLATGKAYCWGG